MSKSTSQSAEILIDVAAVFPSGDNIACLSALFFFFWGGWGLV